MRLARSVAHALSALLILLLAPATAHGQVVISQIFGGGGNTGSPFSHDFVELFNRGASPIALDGWSLQFGSATGTTPLGASATTIALLSGLLFPGQFLLVQGAGGAGGGAPLPGPVLVDPSPFNLSATSGKVALARTTASLATTCPIGPTFDILVADFVGFGTSNCFEGLGAAPLGGSTRALARADGGCRDSGSNVSDFAASIPTPRTSASERRPCRSGEGTSVVPEPTTLTLAMTGLLALACVGMRRVIPRTRRTPAPR